MTSNTPNRHPLLFYCFRYPTESAEGPCDGIKRTLPASYQTSLWKPALLPNLPSGLSNLGLRLKFVFRWGVHRLHLFAGNGSGIFLIHHSGQLVHYSAFTPRYWRFPFVGDDDFQIGDTWTEPGYRRRGLASFAIRQVLDLLAKPGRKIWYVVDFDNEPSIRAVENANFVLMAEGDFVKRWGLKLPGAFVIAATTTPDGVAVSNK